MTRPVRRLLLLWGVGARKEEKWIGDKLGGCVDSFYRLIRCWRRGGGEGQEEVDYFRAGFGKL